MAGNLVLVVAIAVAVAALLLFGQFVYWSMQSRAEQQARELSRRLGTLVEKSDGAALLRAASAPDAPGFVGNLEALIRQAGNPYTLSTLFTRMALAAFLGIILMFVLMRSPVALVGAGLGYLPVVLLSRTADARARRLAEQLPEGLELLARSLQAGHGLAEALRGAAEEVPLPLGQEFGRVYEEQNLGRDFRECLANLCRRNPSSFDLQIFVSAVLLQRDTGGNLVEILQSIAGTVRGRFLFQGKVRALTSEARLTAYILGGLPFFVVGVIAILSPNYLTPLFHDLRGQVLLGACICWFSLGIFVMREISQVEL